MTRVKDDKGLAMENCPLLLATKHLHIVLRHREVIVIDRAASASGLDCATQDVACEITARRVAVIGTAA